LAALEEIRQLLHDRVRVFVVHRIVHDDVRRVLTCTFELSKGRVFCGRGSSQNFRPMPYEGHQDECFSVQAQTFCYSDYVVTVGFNNSASHGGPIREGLRVRVSYIGNTIIRLEVATNTPATSNAAKSDPLGHYEPENKNLTDCLNKANPGDPAGLSSETQAQAAARKACIDKYAR